MSSRRFKAPGVVATLFALLGLALLLWLGTWQSIRYQEKSAAETQRDALADAEPHHITSLDGLNSGELDFHPVTLQGVFAPEPAFLIKHRVFEGKPGYWLVSPLILQSGDAVLVNRGWVPYEEGETIASSIIASSEEETLHGLVHFLDRVVADDATRQAVESGEREGSIILWDSYDTEGMRRAIDAPTPTRAVIVTLAEEHSGAPYPFASYAHITEPYLSAEKHFGYALTWYSLAVALIAIYLAAGFGLLRASPMAPREDGRIETRS
ncbi:SURF1 family protein [Lujinxingia sediminis]|uniref:SURF1-like protein n=1 Tax=Lujinxingia sediminis TaxID=2480984 RepID=A0ABY0CTD0_9DELT|nr:SURF1 family protein [Lujinxingia sediminis]RVU44062.1 SURF1 family protein [Lujinxingia sediminis]